MRGLVLGGLVAGALTGAFLRPAATLRVIRMGGASGARFEPVETQAQAGDTLRFLNLGGFHNVEFLADSISDSARRLLARAMPGERIGPLSSPLLLEPQERYEITVPALPPGRYPFVCLPHAAGGMQGLLVVLP